MVDPNRVGTYTVTYNITDQNGNAADEVTLTVHITEDETAPVITLLGDASISIEAGQPFVDPGATAADDLDGDLTDDIVVGSDLDVNTIGTYTVTYDVMDAAGNAATQVTRTITVVGDETPPVITPLGKLDYFSQFDEHIESGYSTDRPDAHTGSKSTLSEGVTGFSQPSGVECSGLVTYAEALALVTAVGARLPTLQELQDDAVKATGCGYDAELLWTQTPGSNSGERWVDNGDSANSSPQSIAETATAYVRYIYDNEPTLETTLATAYANLGETYLDEGATATDNLDGDLTENMVVTNNVDTSVEGTYTVTYNVMDAAGNAAVEVTRTVVVAPDNTAPIILLVGNAITTVEAGKYIELGATAIDNFDGDVSDNIVIGGVLDPLTEGTYSVTYDVSDAAGNAATQVTRSVTVTADVTTPVIESSTTAEAIDENSGAGQNIYTIEAADLLGVTSYGIGGTDESHFTVNATTGVVTLTNDPDYETKSSYEFTVTASDAAGNSSAAIVVTLAINDLNDNAPVFTSGATAIIAEGETATGYTASATDADAGATIRYSITGGADHALFTLTDGALSFSAAPDYEAPGDDDSNNDYEVVISASDGTHGTPQTVTVTVTDVDDIATELLDTPEGNHNEGVATIDLTLSEDVSLSGESIAGDFTITGAASNPVVSSLSVSGSEVTLTLSGVVVQGETVYLSYTKSVNAGSIVDASGNRLGDFSGQEVNFVTFDLNEPKGTEIFFTNPVRDRLEIRSESVVKRVALYSLTGRKVLDQRPNRQSPSIDISSLAQAIYLMSVETETNQITVKLVKR